MADGNDGGGPSKAKKRKPPATPAGKKPARAGKRKRDDDETEPPEPKNTFKGIFARELGDIMYGFGDSTANPVPETLDAVEAIAVNFVKDVLTKCLDNVSIKGKIDIPDIQFVLRKDVPKAQRAMELIVAKEKTKKFRSVEKVEDFDVEDIQDSVQVHEGFPGDKE